MGSVPDTGSGSEQVSHPVGVICKQHQRIVEYRYCLTPDCTVNHSGWTFVPCDRRCPDYVVDQFEGLLKP